MLALVPDEAHRDEYRNGSRFVAAVHEARTRIDELSCYFNRCDMYPKIQRVEFPDIHLDGTGHLGFHSWSEDVRLSIEQVRREVQIYGFRAEITGPAP